MSTEVFNCVHCRKPITDISMGMMAEDAGVLVPLHKVTCDPRYKGGFQRPGVWFEMTDYLRDPNGCELFAGDLC